MKTPTLIVSALVISGCGRSAEGPTTGFEIQVAPLSLPEIEDACYRVTVTNGPGRTGDIVWQQDALCSDRFGDGRGSLAYVGSCDADAPGPNSVTLELLDLTRGGSPIGDATWVNPCGEIADWSGDRATLVAGEDLHGPCTIDKVCVENSDIAVTFDITVMRDAVQGFFDVAVDFEDIFCSAKLDCHDALLHDGAERGATAVVAFACAAGEEAETHLYVSDLVLTCDGTPALAPMFLPAAGTTPGQHPAVGTGVFAWADYQGDEQLTSRGLELEKCFWNRAVGLDRAALAGRNCTLSGIATASETPLDPTELATPGHAYPMVTWSVQVLSADGALCGPNPLGGKDSGTQPDYVDASTPPAVLSALTGQGHFECGVDAAPPVTCAAGPTLGDSPTAVTVTQDEAGIAVTAGGATTTLALDGALAGYSLAQTCCQHACCGTP